MSENISFTICLADIPIGVAAMFAETKCFCKDYLTDAEPRWGVSVQPDDLAFERKQDAAAALREGRTPTAWRDTYLEQLALYRKIAERLPGENVLLMHGSVIAVDGEAFAFTAKSGVGKSTHTRLWREHFGTRAVMINDDKPLLRIDGNGVYAYGTPWDGKHHLSTNAAAPLKGIAFLSRGETNRIASVDAQEGFVRLLPQCYRPTGAAATQDTLRLLGELAETVPFYQLSCNMEPEAAEVAYRGMKGETRCD